MSLFRQYFSNCFSNCFSTTKTTLKSFSLSIKSAYVSVSFSTTLRVILSLTPRSTMLSLQGIKNMNIFQNNKCNFHFLGIAFIPLSLSHKLDTQVYSSCLFSKILSCSLSQHDSCSAPWIHMVFTTQHDVCFINYVSDYFRADILHLQSPPFSFVCRSSTTIFWFSNHVPHLETSTPNVIFPPRDVHHTMLFSPMRYAFSVPEHHHSPPAWLHTKLKQMLRCQALQTYRLFLHV